MTWTKCFRWIGAAALLICTSCARNAPPRHVIESAIGGYRYETYQRVDEIELPIEENPAEQHAATYIDRAGPERAVSVSVIAYTSSKWLAQRVRRR